MECMRPILLDNPKFGGKSWFPCGQCLACRINRTSEWSLRLLHELQYWKDAIFLTLTYSDEFVPTTPCGKYYLKKSDFVDFKDALRNKLRKDKRKFKYFASAEYGEKFGRCHFHAIMFGLSADDYDLICQCWQKGRVDIGTVTSKSCSYVTGYIQKKLNGKKAVEEYGFCRPAPFQLQSQGLGLMYALDNVDTILSKKGLRQNGQRVSVPRYYSKKIVEIQDSLDNRSAKRRAQAVIYERLASECYDNGDKHGFEYYTSLIPKVGMSKQKQVDLLARQKIYHRQKM